MFLLPVARRQKRGKFVSHYQSLYPGEKNATHPKRVLKGGGSVLHWSLNERDQKMLESKLSGKERKRGNERK